MNLMLGDFSADFQEVKANRFELRRASALIVSQLKREDNNMAGLNPIVLTVSIITLLNNGIEVGSATGFFYSFGNRIFLVSNKHVFINPKENSYPDKFKLHLHINANDISKNKDFEFPIYSNGKPLWKTHAKFTDADVAVIEIDTNAIKQGGYLIKTFSKENFLPDTYTLDPGEDVFIMGYPLAFYDQSHNLPIFRNAIVASMYGVEFQNMPLFLTDANLHPGTSGSPVVTKPKNIWVDDKGNTNMMTGTIYHLVGVHSGTIDPSMTHGQTIGLGASWYIQLIEDITSTF